ncbi:MAG: hypothetical protein EOP06_11540 [Proteobacteria bacterium]|nr:MAG: hypothetical protein EOP06_11540 [Pseudomonadota bacterium]
MDRLFYRFIVYAFDLPACRDVSGLHSLWNGKFNPYLSREAAYRWLNELKAKRHLAWLIFLQLLILFLSLRGLHHPIINEDYRPSLSLTRVYGFGILCGLSFRRGLQLVLSGVIWLSIPSKYKHWLIEEDRVRAIVTTPMKNYQSVGDDHV